MAGLIGGVAAGKSRVARELERLGAARIDADTIAREVLGEPGVVDTLVACFGESVRSADGTIDRKALGRRVFDRPDELRRLEEVVHPRIRARIASDLAALPEGAIVVLDAVLLLENGLDAACDLVVMVDAPGETREARAVRERGWEPGEVSRREGNQMPVAEKRRRADVVLENDGTPEELRDAVTGLWKRLTRLAGRASGPRRTP